jgi:hypothetical protein
MDNLSTTQLITTAIRCILNTERYLTATGFSALARLDGVKAALQRLEQDIPSRDPSAFETANLDAFGYATVLGYMNEHDPLTLQEIADPVRDTISLGLWATARCQMLGLKVVRVPACDHVKARYRKVTHVNAYPVGVLAEVIFGEMV